MMSEIAATNNGDWDPAAGGVTGPGLLDLFGGFTYSGDGANSGSFQNFTLTGLTPGQTYTLRLYIRLWDTDGSGRPIDLSFDNGGTISRAPILEDRPAIDLGGGAATPRCLHVELHLHRRHQRADHQRTRARWRPRPSGSFHLYGLTNEEGGSLAAPQVTSITRAPGSGVVTIVFDSVQGAEYSVDFSTDLQNWLSLDDGLESQGDSTTATDSFFAPSNPARVYYRIYRN